MASSHGVLALISIYVVLCSSGLGDSANGLPRAEEVSLQGRYPILDENMVTQTGSLSMANYEEIEYKRESVEKEQMKEKEIRIEEEKLRKFDQPLPNRNENCETWPNEQMVTEVSPFSVSVEEASIGKTYMRKFKHSDEEDDDEDNEKEKQKKKKKKEEKKKRKGKEDDEDSDEDSDEDEDNEKEKEGKEDEDEDNNEEKEEEKKKVSEKMKGKGKKEKENENEKKKEKGFQNLLSNQENDLDTVINETMFKQTKLLSMPLKEVDMHTNSKNKRENVKWHKDENKNEEEVKEGEENIEKKKGKGYGIMVYKV
ncbi:uncharacterized protein LOC131050285 [Cryptomeria japonica]|uniref:uncharacterized protein LOC131050285 n=1 Tax=Cryptomeria japonica TaxID=3369 RepID=UPI0027D9D1F1|nr:uncharacterized protein LOC131050285 [Cryptomeria japonica]